MALYALDDLDDALDVTRSFLTPVDRTTWVKLAVVALFVGGTGTNVFSWSFGGGGNGGPTPGAGQPTIDLGPQVWLLIAGVVGVLLLLGLGFMLVSSIMEFVFVESLRNEAVTIRRYWSRRWRQGLRLFGFRIVIGLLVLASVALLAAPFVLPVLGVAPIGGGMMVAAFLVLLPLFLVLAIVVGLVNGFTTVFVVPVMILEDCGVLAGWRRLWPTITGQWKQYLAYAVAGFFLSIVGGVAVGILTALGALVLLIPFGILFVIGGVTLVFASELAGIAILVVVGIAYALAVIAVAALAQVPVKAYLRYYALLVLGDVDSEFDLVAEQRARVRGDDAGEGASGAI